MCEDADWIHLVQDWSRSCLMTTQWWKSRRIFCLSNCKLSEDCAASSCSFTSIQSQGAAALLGSCWLVTWFGCCIYQLSHGCLLDASTELTVPSAFQLTWLRCSLILLSCNTNSGVWLKDMAQPTYLPLSVESINQWDPPTKVSRTFVHMTNLYWVQNSNIRLTKVMSPCEALNQDEICYHKHTPC